MTTLLSCIVCALIFVLLMGFTQIMKGASAADGMLSAQLFSTCGVAIIVLLSVIQEQSALLNVALTLALLSPITLIAFIQLRKHLEEPK